jgi:hypothetical protein
MPTALANPPKRVSVATMITSPWVYNALTATTPGKVVLNWTKIGTLVVMAWSQSSSVQGLPTYVAS